jgi:hypothetical protein
LEQYNDKNGLTLKFHLFKFFLFYPSDVIRD